MKKIVKTIWTFVFLLCFCTETPAQAKPGNKAILDSMEVLKKIGGFVDGYTNPPTAEETRYYNITRMFFALPFADTKKLLKDKNKFARGYGFSILTKVYFDSLTKADLEIFKDTASLPLYTQRGVIDAGITLGQYCEMGYASTINGKKKEAKQQDVITAIKTFIKGNAKYPDSYAPKEFSNYSWSGDDDDMSFEIEHKYQLKQNDGTSVEVQNYFILDHGYKITLIETTRSNTIKINPPKVDEWLKLYGKN